MLRTSSAILFLILAFFPGTLRAATDDFDDDGLRDEVESNSGTYLSPANTGTNPNLADSDGDSMPDGMEVTYGTNPTQVSDKMTRPNIIYIVADDMGYGDVGCFWQNQKSGMKFATPGLDSMAAQGAMLTHHYVAASICAPSRSSFLQGRSQGHASIRDIQFDSPLPQGYNVAGMLQSAGYQTIHIGKAGLAGRSASTPTAHPLDRGFDRFFGYLLHGHAHEHYPRNGLGKNGAQICNDRTFITDAYQDLFSADAFTAFAKKSIVESASQSPQKPFFIYLAYDTPHFDNQYPPTPTYPPGAGLQGGLQWTGSPSYVNTAINDPNRVNNPLNKHPSVPSNWGVDSKPFVSMVRRLDDSVADILQTLRDLGISENTLVVFTADNGPEPIGIYPPNFESYGPFEGTKADLLEGGIRVPAIAWWPGTLQATNQQSNIRRITRPIANYDWLSTFAELALCPAPAFADGTSVAPTLTGRGAQQDKGFLYFELNTFGSTSNYNEFPNHRNRPRNSMQAIRMGNFMGLRTSISTAEDPFMIFDVVNDPKQSLNLASSRPELQREMRRLSTGARRSIATTTRPYDTARTPAVVPTSPVKPGLKWKSFEGYWPWLPDFRTLAPTANGETSGINPLLGTRAFDRGLMLEGYLSIASAGSYTFQMTSSAESSLWIHESHVIDNDFGYSPVKTSTPVHLDVGLHPIRIHSRHRSGDPILELRYSGPGISMRSIPSSILMQDGQPTVLSADSASTAKTSPVTVDVLANDTAENPLQLVNVGPPRKGSAIILDGKVIYTPTASFLGKDEFSYSVNDGVQTASSTVQTRVLFDNEMWIPLDEGAGTTVNAYGSETATPGVLSGTVNPSTAWVSGRLGRAISFDGVDMQVQFPALAIPAGNSARSFSCWIKTDHNSLMESQTLLTYGQGSGEQRFTIRLDRGPSSPGSLVVSVEALPGKIMGTKSLNDGAWHHLVVVLADEDQNGTANLSEVKLYVDGQPDLPSSVTPGIPLTANESNLLLGGRSDSGNGNFKGLLDDVRILPRALTATEAGAIHQLTLANVIFDTDGDGLTDLEEEVAGTNPSDPSSFFRLNTTVLASGSINLTWAGVAGRTYVLEESDQLGEWNVVGELAPLVIHEATPNAAVTLPTNGDSQRFFRMKISLTTQSGPDQDRDGFPDAAEVMAGTDPGDPNSFFKIDQMTTTQSGISLQWNAVAGRRYRVEESNNLFQWTRVRNLPPVEATTAIPNASIVVPANGEPKRFLRMQVEPAQ